MNPAKAPAELIFAALQNPTGMTISYNWLHEYLPEKIEPEKLSKILTAIGLEVESMTPYESIQGGLAGLVIGEVLTREKHPDADKLSLTTVNTGGEAPLQIVCGAPNVAAGQKVVVAPIGTTIYPSQGDPLTMKKAKIRGVESFGMICAEDEIGMGNSHDGILVLPGDAPVGTAAADYFKPYNDILFEIGLTPNRMDAMSHLGVARDVCAYLVHHHKQSAPVRTPIKPQAFKPDQKNNSITVEIRDEQACARYCGVVLSNIIIAPSPAWLQDKLRAIGQKPINNLVDVTNYILHETGQPLHAFDADKIRQQRVIVQLANEKQPFLCLDGKTRELQSSDLVIADTEGPMCLAGVYGGQESGVTETTTRIFLESAWFHPTTIRKTSLHHGLRTDAATRFEKGVDIAQTADVLKRAAVLIREITGCTIDSDIIDIYPHPRQKTEVVLKYHYLKKLSGKHYHVDTVRDILSSLGFEIIKEGQDDIRVAVPFSKPDISIPADLVEEIMRIDGLDNIDIPQTISLAPAVETLAGDHQLRERIANYLVGQGFREIFTNSITNSAYYNDDTLATTVKMMNSLSAGLNVMRPSTLETGLEAVAYNINRKNSNLLFFEMGKTYSTKGTDQYSEKQHISLYLSGASRAASWRNKSVAADMYFLKGVVQNLATLSGLSIQWTSLPATEQLGQGLQLEANGKVLGHIAAVQPAALNRFDIKQAVYYADIFWDSFCEVALQQKIQYREISKFPAVQRDLAIVVDQALRYEAVEQATQQARVNKLTHLELFDIFESEKLGAGKKSMAISFTFQDHEKTLTDKEIDGMMKKLIDSYEKHLQADIRKG